MSKKECWGTCRIMIFTLYIASVINRVFSQFLGTVISFTIDAGRGNKEP